MIKVLFVCLGNICRSTMAEGLMKKYLRDEGLEHFFHVESRATSTYEIGSPPHPSTQTILRREGAMLIGKYAKQISHHDYEYFDYIIGMDHDNIGALKKHTDQYKHKIYLLRDIDENAKGKEVSDPYYTGHYEETYQLISHALKKWIDYLKKTI